METGGQVSAESWHDIFLAWKAARASRDKALDCISEAAQAAGIVGRMLLGVRHNCATQSEFVALLDSVGVIEPQDAKRCMAIHERIACKQIDTSDHASVRQLLLDVGLMPPPAPGSEPMPQSAPWWARMTCKLDAKIGKMGPEEKAGLLKWCRATAERLAR